MVDASLNIKQSTSYQLRYHSYELANELEYDTNYTLEISLFKFASFV